MKYEVQDAPVAYGDRMYSKGEVLEASEEHMCGFLQAGYVKEAEAKESKRRSKK
ncbi:MAG: hypothetical protein H0W21_00395 [Actinobacteria bacterium]|nr:hypothetical protein [Actinomycetota bacterium]